MYTRLDSPSVNVQRLFDRVEAANSNYHWGRVTPSFHPSILLDPSILDGDDQVQQLIKAFNLHDRIRLLKSDEMSVYCWHTDTSRKCSINLLLNAHETSYTLFGTPKQGTLDYLDIKRLKYEQNYFYLFDTQTPHMVVNLDPNPRYLLSIGISVPYQMVLKWMQIYL